LGYALSGLAAAPAPVVVALVGAAGAAEVQAASNGNATPPATVTIKPRLLNLFTCVCNSLWCAFG